MECLRSASKIPFFDFDEMYCKYKNSMFAANSTYDPTRGRYVHWMTKAQEKFDDDIKLLVEENEATERSLNPREPDEQSYLDC